MKLLRYIGNKCDNDDYRTGLYADNTVVVDTRPSVGNVSISFRSNRKIQMRLSPVVRDLFDLCALVFIADELQSRPDSWSRMYTVKYPVRNMDVWRTNSIHLENAIRFLTGDTYTFEYFSTRSLWSYGSHRTGPPRGFNTVCLFSGGLDSLLGAIQLLEHGHHVVLVGHYADSITASAQNDLYRTLRERFGEAVVMVQCSLSRSRRLRPQYELPQKTMTVIGRVPFYF